MNGKALRFHLSGINNQNFIMRDEETGTWWQQVSGEAILGPLKGHKLERVPQDELTFARWRREQPRGRVLRPDPHVTEYAGRTWEADIAKLPTVTPLIDRRLEPRTLVVGIRAGGHAKAYPIRLMGYHHVVQDTVGGTPIVATY